MSSTLSRCLHLHSTATAQCRHSLMASAASYLSASHSAIGSSMSMSMLASSSSLASMVGQGRTRVAGLGAGARTRRLRMAMFHSTPAGMYGSRNKKPSSKLKSPKKSSKLASISSIKGNRSKIYPGKADSPKEGTNILDIEQRRASGGGGGGDRMRDKVGPSDMSYKTRSRMYARENEKEKRDKDARRKLGKVQREASKGKESGTRRANKYFDEPPSPPSPPSSRLSSSSSTTATTSSGPRVTAVLDSTAKALGSASSSSSSSSSFARDEAPHRNLAAAVQTHTRWGDIPRDSRPPGRVRGVGARRRGWDAVGAGRSEGKDAGKYNDRPLFDPEGTFRGTEEIFFDRSPSLGSYTHRKQADDNGVVSTAIRDALSRSEGRMAGTPLPERMPFRHKVQIERQVLRAMDTAGSGNSANGNNGYDNSSAVYAYRQRKGHDDLGFVLGEMEDAKRRRNAGADANEASGSWVGYDRSRGRMRAEEDEGGSYEDNGENEILIEGIDESLERGHDGGEFYRPTKLVQPVGESGVDLPSSSSSSQRGSKEMIGKTTKKEAVDLQRYIDKELQDTPQTFDQARLLDGFKKALGEMFGRSTSSKSLSANEGPSRGAKPTPIQALSLRWIAGPQLPGNKLGGRSGDVEAGRDAYTSGANSNSLILDNEAPPVTQTTVQKWRQYLLAAETGSGKSIAYLLPVLQSLKLSESAFQARQRWELQRAQSFAMSAAKEKSKKSKQGKADKNEGEDDIVLKKKIYEHNPRALILAPTHELARQLASFAKDLVHQPDTKLRVMCASRQNVDAAANTRRDAPSSMPEREILFDNEHEFETSTQDVSVSNKRREGSNPVDVLVGTPMKILEMVYGRGWDRLEEHEQNSDLEEDNGELDEEGKPKKLRRGRDKMVHFGKWKHRSELGLENIEWVVVDEADVLFDPDFEATTKQLLESIAAARAASIPSLPAIETESSSPASSDYPFNLLLTSATIPTPLNAYLEKNHPRMLRLASPRLHKLPKTVQTEYVGWTGGNKFADVLRRARKVWAEDWGRRGMDEVPEEDERLSKILVFCNRSSKVLEMSKYFEEQGVPNVPVTSKSEHRGRGSNRHLEGFLREKTHKKQRTNKKQDDPEEHGGKDSKPRVLITTSLLSRGLDFSPSIKHVFIIDEPRNMIDFLHRAGRVGRAGERGTVVLFGKMKGRGSLRGKEVRRRVGGMI